jgi:type IV secretory pathway TrbD component
VVVSRKVLVAVVLVVVCVAVMELVSERLVETNGGHAQGHLASAQGAFPLVPLLAVMIWALPKRSRSHPLIWLAALMIVVGGVIDVIGNLEVVDAIGDATWNDAEAQRLGPAQPGFEEGHDVAERGMRIVSAGAVVFAGVMAVTRNVHPVTALASAGLSLVFPPWLAPGFGLIVILVAVLRRRNRIERSHAKEALAPT